MSWNHSHAIDTPFVKQWNIQTLRCRAVPCQESNDGGWGDPMILKARIDPNCFREHLDSAWMSTCSARWSVLTQPTDTIKIHLSWFVWSFYTKQSSSQTWLTQGNHLSSALFFSMPECQDLLGWLWNCHARSHNMFLFSSESHACKTFSIWLPLNNNCLCLGYLHDLHWSTWTSMCTGM